MKLTSRFLLLGFCIASLLYACRTSEGLPGITELPQASAEEVGMAPETLAKIDQVFQAQLDSGHVPCVDAMVLRKGKIIYQFTGGKHTIETGAALQSGGIFRLASMTKPIVGVAIMILHDDGKLRIEDPVSKFIPEFANPQLIETFNEEDSSYVGKPASREVTLKDLLTHTSGVIYPAFAPGSPLSNVYYKHGIIDAWTLEEEVLEPHMATLGGLPLLHEPGSKWTYGMSIDVLGRVVEVLSGQSLADFLQERIFEPLGMDDTYFYLPPEKHDRLVHVYSQNEEGKLVHPRKIDKLAGEIINYPKEGAMTYYSGGGGLSGTTEDYARFGLMLANRGELYGTRILKEETVDLMASNHLDPAVFGEQEFGLSVSVSDAKENALHPDKRGAFGWGGYFSTQHSSDPSEELVIVLMTQSNPNKHAGKMWAEARKLVYEAIQNTPKEEPVAQAGK